jgi:membrane associated rhomboid family serine protease
MLRSKERSKSAGLMILPIGDHPNPRGTAFVTYGLIAANVVVYLLFNVPLGVQRADLRDPALAEYVEVMVEATRGQVPPHQLLRETSAYDIFVFTHGFRAVEPSLSDLFFCMFLHGGFLHLAGNMLFLWIYGDNVERRLGAVRYLVWYLATGVAATLFHALLARDSPFPLVGASGAISGVLGFYFLWFPRNQVRVLWFLPPFLWHVFEIPARIVLGVYLLLDNLLPFLLAGDGGGVAHGAHIGGFIAGLAVAALGDRRRDVAWREPEDRKVPAGPEAVRVALAEGRLEDAAAAYFALPPAAARELLEAHDALALARWLRSAGHPDAALTVLRRAMREIPDGDAVAAIYALAGFILLEDQHQPAAAYQYLLTALDLDPDPHTAREIRRGLTAIDALQKRQVGRLHTPRRW